MSELETLRKRDKQAVEIAKALLDILGTSLRVDRNSQNRDKYLKSMLDLKKFIDNAVEAK